MQEQECGVCRLVANTPALWEDEHWHVVHDERPSGVAGWMILVAKRHVGGPAHFNEGEARSFGVVLTHLERTLERVTGAARIYTAALGESWPHFHCHMVPRYAASEVKGWALFDMQRRGRAGEVVVAAEEIARLESAYAAALKSDPPRP
jgi:diadenosine tetraphosphate (Ap4A) HIT family hydrolase